MHMNFYYLVVSFLDGRSIHKHFESEDDAVEFVETNLISWKDCRVTIDAVVKFIKLRRVFDVQL
jgi:hypothetical protein